MSGVVGRLDGSVGWLGGAGRRRRRSRRRWAEARAGGRQPTGCSWVASGSGPWRPCSFHVAPVQHLLANRSVAVKEVLIPWID